MGVDGLARALTAGLRPDLTLRRPAKEDEQGKKSIDKASHDPAAFACVTGATAAPIPCAVALPSACRTAAVCACCPIRTATTATVRSAVKAARKVPLMPLILSPYNVRGPLVHI